jgi:multidrug resistance efflux pump
MQYRRLFRRRSAPRLMNNAAPFGADTVEALARLETCRVFEGSAKEFWDLFTRTCAEIVHANAARVITRVQGEWRLVAGWPDPREFPLAMSGPAFLSLAEQAVAEMLAAVPATAPGRTGLLLVALAGDAGEHVLLAVALLPGELEHLRAAGAVLRLASDTPLLYLRQRQLHQSKRDLVHYSLALEVLAATNAHTRFLSVAMALVNELAARFRAPRVALGWNQGAYVRVRAVSGTDRFESRMEAVQRLESVMEEARDQDEEILVPPPVDCEAITREHETYTRFEALRGLLSVPVRVEGDPVGVLVLERTDTPFDEDDAVAVRVIADQAARRLEDLARSDRWFGARWAAAWRLSLARLLGPTQTWTKLWALLLAALLIVSVTVPIPFRVSASFLVRAEALQFLPAPFDGYLSGVQVRPGDRVRRGDVLLQLDESDLLVEQAGALAEAVRYGAEAEKAEADRKLADFRAARALERQAQARLDLVRYRLSRCVVRAPFDGVVVEGDLHERIGAPVKAGDVLLKVSQLAGLYVEMRVPERDIDLVERSTRAEVAFTTRPEDRFTVGIERIEPSATADREGNAFLIRASLGDRADWVRPGMGGVARIDVGRRYALWIASHRLLDFLRLKLWW